jgi:acetaldehyde dehydrogenase/alcohol dehydrogenase
MAHKLGSAFHITHGSANAMLLANVIRYNANDNPTKQAAFSQYDRPKAKCRYAEIATHLGLAGETSDEKVESLVAWIEGLNRQLGVAASIQQHGIPEAEFLAKVDGIALDAFDDQCTGANPRYPLIDELKAILLDSYYGRPFVELYLRRPAMQHDEALAGAD